MQREFKRLGVFDSNFILTLFPDTPTYDEDIYLWGFIDQRNKKIERVGSYIRGEGLFSMALKKVNVIMFWEAYLSPICFYFDLEYNTYLLLAANGDSLLRIYTVDVDALKFS